MQNYSHGVSVGAPQWDKGKDLVTEPRPWDVSSSLLGWKNPSCIYWGEGSGGEDQMRGFPPSRKGLESEETRGAPVFQVRPTKATQLRLPLGNTEALQNFHRARRAKLKWGTGRETANQETPPWQGERETTGKKKKW